MKSQAKQMSALEVTWSEDWDVSQVSSKEPLPSNLMIDSSHVTNSSASLGTIENLWFFCENKMGNIHTKQEGEEKIIPPETNLPPLELNIHCSLSSTSSSILVACSAKFIELFTFICEPKTEVVLKASYVKTSRGKILSASTSWEHLYIHEVILPPVSDATVDGIQLKFLSLSPILPLPESLLLQEPQLCNNYQNYRIIQVAKIDIRGVKTSSALAPSEKILATSTLNEQNGNISTFPSTAPKDMMMAMMIAAMSSKQQQIQPSNLVSGTISSMASASLNASNAYDKHPIEAPRKFSDREVSLISADTSITNISNNKDAVNSNSRNGSNNINPPTHLPLIQIQQMLHQMQHQMLSQLSQQITLACQPLHQRMQQLESKIDNLSIAIANNQNQRQVINNADKDYAVATDASADIVSGAGSERCDFQDSESNLEGKKEELALLRASYDGIVKQLDNLTKGSPDL